MTRQAVLISEDHYERLSFISALSHDALTPPLSVEDLVEMAVGAFLDGTATDEEFPGT